MRLWTNAEDAIITRYYPLHGTGAVLTHISGRTAKAVAARAKYIGLTYRGPKLGGSPKNDSPYAIPSQEFADDHRAWQSVRMPVFGALAVRL